MASSKSTKFPKKGVFGCTRSENAFPIYFYFSISAGTSAAIR